MCKWLSCIAAAAIIAFGAIVSDVDAKGRGGGGFGGGRSSSSRSGSSYKSSSRSSSSKATKPSASRPKPKVQTAKSKADQAAYQKAKSSGKAFSTKKAAVSDFKSKAKTDPKTQAALSKSYPTKYTKEPATRPAHIPATHGGQTVIYQNGGYGTMSGGSFSPLMTYMLMDTMTDAMLMSSMKSQGYHVGTAPTVQYAASSGPSRGMTIFLWFMGITFVIILGVVIYNAATGKF